jgi:tetratricopeptide (TPR) repeat protein
MFPIPQPSHQRFDRRLDPPLADRQFSPLAILRYQHWIGRSTALMQASRYESALNCVNQAIGLRPDRASAWRLRTVALIYLERYAEALESADRALFLGLDDPEIWVLRAVALNRLGRYRACYASYERAMGREYRPWTQVIAQRLTRQRRQIVAAVRGWKTGSLLAR